MVVTARSEAQLKGKRRLCSCKMRGMDPTRVGGVSDAPFVMRSVDGARQRCTDDASGDANAGISALIHAILRRIGNVVQSALGTS